MSESPLVWSRSHRAHAIPLADIDGWVGRELFCTDWRRVDRAHLDQFHWSVDSVPEASDTSANAAFPRGADNIDGVMLVALVQAAFFNNFPFWAPGVVAFNYGFDRLRFPSTVYLEDELRLRASLLTVESKPAGVLCRSQVTMDVKERDRPAMAGEFLVMMATGT